MESTLDLKNNLQNKFVAFIDVMGFSNIVNKGGVDELERYFTKIIDELKKIKKDKYFIESFLISDSIILIAPEGLQGLKQLVLAVRRIQSALLWRNILLRGAISYGEIYYNGKNNIVVGKGFIRAYLLEQEAVFPRVIIDPSIIKIVSSDRIGFIKQLNKNVDYNFEDRLIYINSEFSLIKDDSIFIDYSNKTIRKEDINGNITNIYNTIINNLYSEQKLYSKYVWLRDYFLECLRLTYSLVKDDTETTNVHKDNLIEWIKKFERI